MATRSKTLFHDALVRLGPKRVTVGRVLVKDGAPDKVELTIDEQPWLYSAENAACSLFFKGHSGQTFTVLAEGDKEAAKLTYLGEPGVVIPPKPDKAQALLVPGGTAEETKALKGAVEFVQRNRTIAKVALRAFNDTRAEFEAFTGKVFPLELSAPLFGTLLYGASQAGFGVHKLPRWLDMATLKAMVPGKAAATGGNPSPPKPRCHKHPNIELSPDGSCVTCVVEAAEASQPDQQEDDVPF